MSFLKTSLSIISAALWLSIASCTPDSDLERNKRIIGSVKKENLPEFFIEFASNLYSGGEPTAKNFQELKKMGIQTIVSVDGEKPQAECAKALGMRYVHLPIGYDTVPYDVAASLEKLDAKLQNKTYIHCHHGKHRGPAVAAIYSLLSNKATPHQALQKMQEIGTGKEYKGLWESVRKFDRKKLSLAKPRKLVAYKEVDDFTSSMAGVDRHYDAVKLHLKKFKSSTLNKEELAHQCVLLEEALKESSRLKEHDYATDEEFLKLFKSSVKQASHLRKMVESGNTSLATRQFKELKRSCRACHSDFRN